MSQDGTTTGTDSVGARARLEVDGSAYEFFRLDAVTGSGRLPYSLKVLLENVLRNEDGRVVTAAQAEAIGDWDPASELNPEVQFTPARVLMQDFTGVPCVVDLVAMRDAMTELGGDASAINPQIPAELVIDHSVIADSFASPDSFGINARLEFERNQERYQLLRWGQQSFDDFLVVPPDTGICHQVNLEYLSRVVFTRGPDDARQAYPDTLVGTDSHTPMVNGLGVLGWGVGGIEAEAAMLGQPMSMLIPQVIGIRLSGELREGTTATDLVLTVAELLRGIGVVGKFVEFFGPGVANVPLATRATIGNMSPEYGSTATMFPIDSGTLDYLRLTGRQEHQIRLVEAYAPTGAGLGIRGPDLRVRVRILDPRIDLPLRDVESPVEQLATLWADESGPRHLVVVENLTTFLALPDLPRTVAVFGRGFAVGAVASLPWALRAQIIYWGDLDSHGFAILDRLRHHAPDVTSVLMDSTTLDAWRQFAVPDPSPTRSAPTHLTADELDTLERLTVGGDLRVEQERIPWDWAIPRLRGALRG